MYLPFFVLVCSHTTFWGALCPDSRFQHNFPLQYRKGCVYLSSSFFCGVHAHPNFQVLCTDSHFQHNFPLIIHEGVGVSAFFVLVCSQTTFLGHCVQIRVFNITSPYNTWRGGYTCFSFVVVCLHTAFLALCPDSRFQHNFPLIVHEGVGVSACFCSGVLAHHIFGGTVSRFAFST